MKRLPFVLRFFGFGSLGLTSILALACGLWLVGCGSKPPPKLTASEEHVFDSAPPALAQMWQAALSAGRTNDYVGAQTLLYALTRSDLSPEQSDAVGKEITSLKQQLNAAAQKGDPAALKALNELRQNSIRRRASGE